MAGAQSLSSMSISELVILTDEAVSEEGATELSFFLLLATCCASGSSSLSESSNSRWSALRLSPVLLFEVEVDEAAEAAEVPAGPGPDEGSENCFGRGREVPPPHPPCLAGLGLTPSGAAIGRVVAGFEANFDDDAAAEEDDLTGGAGFFSKGEVFAGLTGSAGHLSSLLRERSAARPVEARGLTLLHLPRLGSLEHLGALLFLFRLLRAGLHGKLCELGRRLWLKRRERLLLALRILLRLEGALDRAGGRCAARGSRKRGNLPGGRRSGGGRGR